MATQTSSVVAASFETSGHAEAALDELWHSGFSREQIGMAAPGHAVEQAETPAGKLEETAAEGAVVGATAGGAIGALAGVLVTTLIPGIGPVLTGGALAGVGLGTAAGAAAGTYLGPFLALGLTKQQSKDCGTHLQAGRTIVLVNAPERSTEAREIMHRHGGHDTSLPQPESGT
jgi:hypothetical protein